MKDTKNDPMKKEQKLYALLLGFGICTLAVMLAAFGTKAFFGEEPVEQQVRSGDNNAVSGPVAGYKKEDTEEKTESENTAAKEVETKKEKKVEKNTDMEAGYDGKKKLSWPVTGNVIIPYSMDTTVYFETLDQYQCNPGLHIKVEKGTEVKAVHEGKVTNVKKDARYGILITTDLGNGYKAYYGQLADCPWKKGDIVKAGDVLGRIGEPTDYFKLEGPHLYFKMTHQGKEINPADYL